MATVTIPVMAKVRIGHFAEAAVLQALEVDFIDESEVLTPADEENHVWKHDFRIPFVCGARNLGEALRRIAEGAAMIRTKGEAGSGNVVEAVRHMRTIVSQMKKLTTMRDDELMREAKELGAPWSWFARLPKPASCRFRIFRQAASPLPPTLRWFAAWAPKRFFVGSGIFKSSDPEARAKAVVKATTHFEDAKAVLEASEELAKRCPAWTSARWTKKDLLSTRGCKRCGSGRSIDWRSCNCESLMSNEMSDTEKSKIGILAIQGDFAAHARCCIRWERKPWKCARSPSLLSATR